MSPAPQFMTMNTQQNSHASLAVATVLIYDHVLTLSREIEYIWCKPWTRVSFMFILVRYVGIYGYIVLNAMSGFLPGHTDVKVASSDAGYYLKLLSHDAMTDIYSTVFQGGIVYIIVIWAFILFLGASNFVMILRVWAIYNRSRQILRILLTFFSIEVIYNILICAVASIPRNMSVSTVQILDHTFCTFGPANIPLIWLQMFPILQVAHSAMMCIFIIVQFMRQSFQMYHATKQWRLSRYINLLVKQGLLYFFTLFVSQLSALGAFPTEGWPRILFIILGYPPMMVGAPRFILSIRELYAWDVQSRRGSEIDTGFGLSSEDGPLGTVVVFADVEQNGGTTEISSEGGETE